jgi:hypothetical protein
MLFSAKPMTNVGECSSQRESTIMFLHAEILAQSRSATYSEMGSAEHLFALIDLCELIEQHKKFILKRASSRHKESKVPQRGTEESDAEFSRRLSLQNVIGRNRPASAIRV